MLKKTISYEDFNGDQVTEDVFFHLSKSDLVQLEVSHEGGFQGYLERIVKANDGKTIMAEFRKILLMAYGQKSEDGKRFLKTPENRKDFESSAAFDAIFVELCTDADKAAEFVNGIIPAGFAQEIEAAERKDPPKGSDDTPVGMPEGTSAPKTITKADMVSMSTAELNEKLSAGWTISD